MEVNGNLTTMELKKSHPSRVVGGVQTQYRLVSHPHVVDKFRRDISGAKSPSPTPGPSTQGSNVRKVSPHNFWLQKPVKIESVEETSEVPVLTNGSF